MLQKIRLFLGVERLRALLILFGATGMASVIIGFSRQPWVPAIQTLLAFAFLFGAIVIVVGRLGSDERKKWVAILMPAVGLMLLGALFFPQSIGFFIGGALGWTLVGSLIFGRTRSPMEYRLAIKAMRKNDYEGAVKTMDGLIKSEPSMPNHYRFRAELLRLWGKLPRARKDYEKMREIAQDDVTRAIAFNGLAEIDLQARQYESARQHALQAYALAPQDWVTAYNLAMIEDRLQLSQAVIETLSQKLKARIPDARHRLLIGLYQARAYARLGNLASAQEWVNTLQRERNGLREWETLLKSEQATLLREALAEDVQAARRLLDGEISVEQLVQEQA